MNEANRFIKFENPLIKTNGRFEIGTNGFARIRFTPREIRLTGSIDDGIGRDDFKCIPRQIVDVVRPDVNIEPVQVTSKRRTDLASANEEKFIQAPLNTVPPILVGEPPCYCFS